MSSYQQMTDFYQNDKNSQNNSSGIHSDVELDSNHNQLNGKAVIDLMVKRDEADQFKVSCAVFSCDFSMIWGQSSHESLIFQSVTDNGATQLYSGRRWDAFVGLCSESLCAIAWLVSKRFSKWRRR